MDSGLASRVFCVYAGNMKNHEQHRNHLHTVETEKWNLRNVPLTQTHDLVRCADDTFFGWVPKTAGILKEES